MYGKRIQALSYSGFGLFAVDMYVGEYSGFGLSEILGNFKDSGSLNFGEIFRIWDFCIHENFRDSGSLHSGEFLGFGLGRGKYPFLRNTNCF